MANADQGITIACTGAGGQAGFKWRVITARPVDVVPESHQTTVFEPPVTRCLLPATVLVAHTEVITYHQLKVQPSRDGWRAEVVVD